MRRCRLVAAILLLPLASGCKDEPRAPTPPLHRAAVRRDLGQIKSLLAGGADVNGQDAKGRTALHRAARLATRVRRPVVAIYRPSGTWSTPRTTPQRDVVAALLDAGAAIDAADRRGRTPLHYAIRYGERQVVGLLLERGANVHATDHDGDTPLHMAAFRGRADIAGLLLSRGAKIDVANAAGHTPLHVAAGGRHDPEFVGLFLARGADIDATDRQGQTPVAHAARCGNFEVLQFLLAEGARPPAETERPGRDDPAATMMAVAHPDVETLVTDNSAFAIDLYRQLASQEGNLFFSPYSVSAALAMTYAGARGETERQMAETLHFTLGQQGLHPAFAGLHGWLNLIQRSGDVTLDTANSLWPQEKYPFLESYLSLARDHYGVSITPVDYERESESARRRINRWVQGQTRGKITDLVAPNDLKPPPLLVLVNAIYFKGKWDKEFKPERTTPDTFHVSVGRSVAVPMMYQTTKADYAELDDIQVLGLPYRGDTLSMLILLPREIDGLPSLEDRLSTETIQACRDSLRGTKVRIYLPRFRMTCAFRLEQTLPLMGMTDAFVMGTANFADMDGQSKWLYIGAVLHKAFVDVNEEGTEAAAATAVTAPPARGGTEPPTFRADRPFLFLIQENRTGAILFLGRVTDPTRTD